MQEQKIVYISVDKLHPHPDNPRKNLGDLTELAGSIQAKGILQNLTVVPLEGDEYRVIIGHRRCAAAKQAGLKEVPCVVTTMTPKEQVETMAIENLQRNDLTAYEQAEAFQMMLDMGSTVKETAQTTGFSETTIRSRVSLLTLDKKKFQKAEKRGATMQDYLKLSKIKDPSRRNKVLDAIGTPEFANALKKAVDEEETQIYMQKVRSDFENADWCTELPSDTQDIYKHYLCVRSYNKWNTKVDVERPEDADTAEYFYIVRNPEDIGFYKKRDTSETEARNEVQEMRDKLNEALDKIKKKLTKISQTHRDIRDDFIHDFTAVNNYEMDIEAFAVKALVLVGNSTNPKLDNDRLGNLLGVSRGDGGKLDPGELNSALFKKPQYALLCTAYTILEGEGQKYNGSGSYDYTFYGFPPQYVKNAKLDLIYEGLKSLGYEMSKEEIQMQEGTHPLYKKAQDLIDAFKQAIGGETS